MMEGGDTIKKGEYIKGFPQVLLLGNGVNQAFDGVSWSRLMEEISCREDFDPKVMTSPLPMQAILLTNNRIKEVMQKQSANFYGTVRTDEQRNVLKDLLAAGFDDILTTNYSYELEIAALDLDHISKQKLRSITERTCEKRELRYLLHTYNCVNNGSKKNRIWHIHGESRLPDSMLLGHYWYGNMLGKIIAELDFKKNKYQYRQIHGLKNECDSWVDSFILGDIYILGFGFNQAEIDLWWLLNRKIREKAAHGKVVFYEPENTSDYEKTELLKLFDVKVESFGIKRPERNDSKGSEVYRTFYRKAIEDIRANIAYHSLLGGNTIED